MSQPICFWGCIFVLLDTFALKECNRLELLFVDTSHPKAHISLLLFLRTRGGKICKITSNVHPVWVMSCLQETLMPQWQACQMSTGPTLAQGGCQTLLSTCMGRNHSACVRTTKYTSAQEVQVGIMGATELSSKDKPTSQMDGSCHCSTCKYIELLHSYIDCTLSGSDH